MISEKHSWKELPSVETFRFKLSQEFTGMILDSITDKEAILSDPNRFKLTKELVDFFEAFKASLNENPGFVLLEVNDNHTDQELREIYAVCCRAFGIMNDRYGYFFDVVDQGLDYTKEAIPVSKTKASTGYHTDSTAKEYFPDIVGLLCLNPGATGGDSLLTNAADAYKRLLETIPDSVSVLEEPIIRDVITPGTLNSNETILKNAFPVFSEQDGLFTFRYMRYWIESAHSKTNLELSDELYNGLEAIDQFFALSEKTLQFRMNRGEMLFVNNRFLCHNRTAFENDPSEQKIRTLVRSWINFDVSRI